MNGWKGQSKRRLEVATSSDILYLIFGQENFILIKEKSGKFGQ